MTTFRVKLGPDEARLLLQLWDQFPGGLDMEEAEALIGSRKLASIALSNLRAIGCAEQDRQMHGWWRCTSDGMALIDEQFREAGLS